MKWICVLAVDGFDLNSSQPQEGSKEMEEDVEHWINGNCIHFQMNDWINSLVAETKEYTILEVYIQIFASAGFFKHSIYSSL